MEDRGKFAQTVFKVIDKTLKTIKAPKYVQETNERVFEPTSVHFKPWIKTGGALAVAGGIIKIIAAINPATLPIGIVALAPDMIEIGLAIAGISIQTSKKR